MELTREQIAAAEACGCVLIPATEEQVHRLTMQRRIFLLDGKPHVVTREGHGLYESHGTLAPLIEGYLRRAAERPADAEAAPQAEAGAAPTSEAEPSEAEDALAEMEAAQTRGSGARVIGRRRTGGQAKAPRWATAGAVRRGRSK